MRLLRVLVAVALTAVALAFASTPAHAAPGDFVSKWNPGNVGTSPSGQITLPLVAGTYNFDVDWGDGSSEHITSASATHTYAGYTSGIKTITISSIVAFAGWQFNNGGDKLKITEITQWGNLQLGNDGAYFYGCSNLIVTATDAPDLAGTISGTPTTIFYEMFRDATSFNQAVSQWDTSAVTNMYSMFRGATVFNQDVSNWNTGAVTDMSYLFFGATAFNQDVSNWNTSAVTSMSHMFGGATSFNQDISSWNTSSVTNMSGMFVDAMAFNSPLPSTVGGWNTASVTTFRFMFRNAVAFNQDISSWNTSSVTNMSEMFNDATAFNSPPCNRRRVDGTQVPSRTCTSCFSGRQRSTRM